MGLTMSSHSSVNQGQSVQGESPVAEAEIPSLLDREIPAMIRRAQAVFRRDLPQLLVDYPHRWVVYHGDRRVAVGSSKRQLFQSCVHQGLPHDELMVRLIEPESTDEFDWNEFRDV
jgi:hypothetical protein